MDNCMMRRQFITNCLIASAFVLAVFVPSSSQNHAPTTSLHFTLPQTIVTRDALCDVTFKILFGKGGEHRTTNFINAVLQPVKLQDRVVAVEVLNNMPGFESDGDAHCVKCMCETVAGNRFMVSLQKIRERTTNLGSQCVYDCARDLCRLQDFNMKRVGADKPDAERASLMNCLYQPVKFICIVDTDTDPAINDVALSSENVDDVLVHWGICQGKSKQLASDVLSWTYVVLPRFRRRLSKADPAAAPSFRGDGALAAWLYLLTRGDGESVRVTADAVVDSFEVADGYRRLSALTAEEGRLLAAEMEPRLGPRPAAPAAAHADDAQG
jgi:hypothetical protein